MPPISPMVFMLCDAQLQLSKHVFDRYPLGFSSAICREPAFGFIDPYRIDGRIGLIQTVQDAFDPFDAFGRIEPQSLLEHIFGGRHCSGSSIQEDYTSGEQNQNRVSVKVAGMSCARPSTGMRRRRLG